MRKFLAILLAIMLMTAGTSALGEIDVSQIMVVANCEDWVSLRTQPDTQSERLAEVPLGEIVTSCEQATGDFMKCEYQGQTGYILSKYLELPILAEQIDGLTVVATRSYVGDGERMEVVCMDAQGNQCWQSAFQSPYRTELSCTDVFLGGTSENPMVMVHVAGIGLRAMDFATGENLWTLPAEEVELGGGLTTALAEDGTMYMEGYYDSVLWAVSADGEVLWQARGERVSYWAYEIELGDDGVVVYYDCIGEDAVSGRICYDYKSGEQRWVELD